MMQTFMRERYSLQHTKDWIFVENETSGTSVLYRNPLIDDNEELTYPSFVVTISTQIGTVNAIVNETKKDLRNILSSISFNKEQLSDDCVELEYSGFHNNINMKFAQKIIIDRGKVYSITGGCIASRFNQIFCEVKGMMESFTLTSI
jgi:hypothetical protein